MAIILEYRRTEEGAARIVKPPVDGSLGEIIIFPGVRIERRTPAGTPNQAGTPSGRRAQRVRKK